MMQASDGEWSRSEIIRTSSISSAVGSELVSQKITGLTSGATAIVEGVNDLTQGNLDVTEFKIAYRNGDFISGETVRGTSSTRDVLQDFTVYNMVVDTSITDRGILYSKGEEVIIVPAVKDEEAKKLFPDGWNAIKPYLRKVPDPSK